MKKKFDLTTAKGLDVAKGFLLMANPMLGLIAEGIKYLFQSKNVEDQSKIVEELIKKGKAEGVSEMEIWMDNNRGGVEIGVPIDGVDIKVTLSAPKDKTIVKVKYNK